MLVSKRLRVPVMIRVLIAYITCAMALLAPVWVHPGSVLAGTGGDAIQQLWMVAAAAHTISHGGMPFYSHLINFPTGVNVLWDGVPFLLVPLFWLLNLAHGPVVAYNGLIVLLLALDAWSCYLVCSRWCVHRSAAVVGGLLFGFGPAVIAESLQLPYLTAAFMLPLAVICLDQLVVRQTGSKRYWGVALGVVAAGQFYLAEELWATMAIVVVIAIVGLALVNRSEVRARAGFFIHGVSWALLVMVPLIVAPLLFQFLGPGAVHGRPIPPSLFTGTLLGFVLPGILQAFSLPAWWGLADQVNRIMVDYGLYVGVPFLVAVGIMIKRAGHERQFQFWLGFCVVVGILLLGTSLYLTNSQSVPLPLPGAILQQLPLLGDYLPVRLDIYLDLGLAILMALFIDRLTWRRADWLARIVAIFAVLSWVPILIYPTVGVSTPAFFKSGWHLSGGSVLVVPFAANVNNDSSMLWQAVDRFGYRTTGGYFTRAGSQQLDGGHGPTPAPLTNDLLRIQDGRGAAPVSMDLIEQTKQYLREHQVRYVVLGPMRHRLVMKAWLTTIMERAPSVEGGVDIWQRTSNFR
jgi:dolichyl-phosphate beta-glucosyltransferase